MSFYLNEKIILILMEPATFIATATAGVKLLKSIKDIFSDNDKSNYVLSKDYENMKNNYENKIRDMNIQTNEKIHAMEIKSLNKEKELDKEYERKISNYQNTITEIKFRNEALEREVKEGNEKLQKQIEKNKKQREKYNMEIDKMKKETENLQNIISINNENCEKQKIKSQELEKNIKELEEESIAKEKKFNDLLISKNKENQEALDIQQSKLLQIKSMNEKQIEENEAEIQKNKIELEKFTKECKEEIEYEQKKFEELEKAKKEEEEEKKKKEEEQKQKDKNNEILAENKFQKEKKHKIQQFLKKLKNKILEKNFFEELLIEYDTKQIFDVINEIIKEVNLDSVFNEKTKSFLNLVETIKVNPEMNHLNILLLGPTGSGKSTLINVLLELEGQERAEVGDDNNPKTMDFHSYTSNKKKYIRCFDSRGIEKNKEYSLDEFIKNSKGLILKKLKENNPDEFIHIILYCFEGDRFINEVRDSLYKLMDLYNDDTLPIILVHTRGVQGEDDELFEIIKKTLERENRKIDMIDICAEKDDDFPAFGIDELNKLMISKVKESVKSACFSSVQNKVKDNFIKVNINYKNSFRKEFEIIIDKEMKNIKLKSNINEQKKEYLKIFSKNVFEKILFDNQQKLNKKCKIILENYLNNFFKWIFEKSENYMINFISQNSYELISDLLMKNGKMK